MSTTKKNSVIVAGGRELTRAGLAAMVSSFDNFDVTATLANAGELIGFLRQKRKRPSLVIFDVDLLVLDGFGTLALLKKEWPQIKVLALSMYNTDYCIVQSLRNGADGFLSKTDTIEAFHKAIQDILQHGVYHSDRMALALLGSLGNDSIQLTELSEKEILLIQLCSKGKSYEEIAREMNLHVRTVQNCRDALFQRLNISKRISLVMFGVQTGIIPLTAAYQ